MASEASEASYRLECKAVFSAILILSACLGVAAIFGLSYGLTFGAGVVFLTMVIQAFDIC